MKFPKVNPKQSFPEMEEKIIAFWKENKTFQKSIDQRPESNPYRFYDGPPFITGTPHYGSLLSSIVKDIVPRYHTMQGKRVERKWGWDCHGLPIEEKVQKKLDLRSNKDIEELGVETFIQECYKYTAEVSAEWDWYIDHIGRWVDMNNAYKTMDQDYMESVLWVFKKMHEKGRIYKGRRVSLYSWKLSTPISNFEVAMDDSYEEVSDPAVTVMFPIVANGDRDTDKELKGAFEYTEQGALQYVLAVIKDANGNILMLKNNKHEGRFQFPGGKVDIGETLEEALRREIREELGVEISNIGFLNRKNQFVQGITWVGSYYEVTLDGIPSIQEPNKHESLEYFSYKTADNILGYTLESTDGTIINELSVLLKTYDTHCLHQIERGIDTSKINTYIIAWTTTPWSIPAHMSMALNKNLAYSRVLSEENYFILATARVETVFKGREYQIVESFMGEDLIGLKYTPPFDFYVGKVDAEKNHKILHADFITDTDGTGIGHQAPEFGEVDFQLAQKEGVHISTALDNAGCYTDEIPAYEGMHYQDANDVVSEKLKELGLLFKKESINHRVAMCPRSGTKLIYKAQDSWFINIQEMKDRLLAENEGINWQPNHLKHGQFLKSIEAAPDWCISRTRYWGTPMPIWMGRDTEGNEVDMKVFGSKSEIEIASGMTVTDLHRPYIDAITWQENGLTYTRLPEVLDVWMDSGSMPYAQMHYPFENKAPMESSYPADFIVEYIGQVRAWFYVMHVVGVALFDKRAFTNVITTGIVMGSDGRKMSKSYGNYPDPKVTIKKYGADAIRFYMANSPLLTGGNMDFKEEGILEVIKKVILPLWNTYSFFTTYANIDGFKPVGNIGLRSNPLDTWIISETNQLVADITSGMENYEITDATRPIIRFMDNLTNWYIRRSRKRFWKSENDGDKMQAYETLYEVLVTLTKVMAPFTPFVTENIYKSLTGNESVHLADFPVSDTKLIDTELNEAMDICQKVINLGLSLRTAQKIRVRQPLRSISIGFDLSDYYKDIIKEELNIKSVHTVDSSSIAQKICKPNGRLIGPKFEKDVKNIISEAKSGNFEIIDENTVKVGEFTLEGDEFEIAYVTQGESDNIESGFGMVITMDLEISQELKIEGYARDIVRHIQEARKEAGYQVDDRITINIIVEDLEAILASYNIASETLSTLDTSLTSGDIEKNIELGDITARIILKK